jgi:competence protein ComEA
MLKKILAGLALACALVLPAFATTPVNINTADAETIAKSLDGVGLAKAKAIVAFREAHGPFKSVDELSEVKGIGAATLEKNHDAILLGEDAAHATAKPAHAKKAKAAVEAAEAAQH